MWSFRCVNPLIDPLCPGRYPAPKTQKIKNIKKKTLNKRKQLQNKKTKTLRKKLKLFRNVSQKKTLYSLLLLLFKTTEKKRDYTSENNVCRVI